MAYKRISGRATEKLGLELETMAVGGKMKKGKHLVTIKELEDRENKIVLTLSNSFGETHQTSLFKKNYSGDSHSFLYKQLIAATAADVQELWALTESEADIETLVGREVNIELESNGGVLVINTSRGLEAGGVVAKTIAELSQELKEKGLKLERTVLKSITEPTEETPKPKARFSSRQNF